MALQIKFALVAIAIALVDLPLRRSVQGSVRYGASSFLNINWHCNKELRILKDCAKSMKTVIPNIWMLLLRIVLLGLFVYIYQWPLEKIRTGQYQNNEGVFWLGLVVVTMFPAYLIWTLLGVLWVTISDDLMTIRFHHVYKSVEVFSSDIDSYYKTVHKTKVRTFNGFFIKLKSGKIVEVTEYNLKSISEVGGFLRHSKVPLRGDMKSRFPLKRRIWLRTTGDCQNTSWTATMKRYNISFSLDL